MFGKLDKNESFPQMERAILEDWGKTRAFEATLSKGKADDSFIFYDGPPFATGLPTTAISSPARSRTSSRATGP